MAVGEREPAQEVRAHVPSGAIALSPGVWLTADAALVAEIEDVLFGPTAPRSGSGWVEARGRFGHCRAVRWFRDGRLRLDRLDGGAAPRGQGLDPAALLGGTRERVVTAPVPSRPPREPDLQQRLRGLEGRARRLDDRAAALESGSRSAEAPWTAGREIVALEAAVGAVFEKEAVVRDREERRDGGLRELLKSLSPGADAPERVAALRHLEEQARAIDALEEADESGASRGTGRVTSEFTGAAALSGLVALGLVFGGVVDLLAWTTLPALPLLGLGAWRLRRRRTALAERRREAELMQQARDALVAIGEVPRDGRIAAHDLRAASRRAARRETLATLRARLAPLVPPRRDRESELRRAKLLKEGVPRELREKLVGEVLRDPLLALPGLMERVRRECRDRERDAAVSAARRGEARGQARLLRAEARALRDVAERLEREIAAAHHLGDGARSGPMRPAAPLAEAPGLTLVTPRAVPASGPARERWMRSLAEAGPRGAVLCLLESENEVSRLLAATAGGSAPVRRMKTCDDARTRVGAQTR